MLEVVNTTEESVICRTLQLFEITSESSLITTLAPNRLYSYVVSRSPTSRTTNVLAQLLFHRINYVVMP